MATGKNTEPAPTPATGNGPAAPTDNTIKKTVDELLAALAPKGPSGISPAEEVRLGRIATIEGAIANLGSVIVSDLTMGSTEEQAIKKSLTTLASTLSSVKKAIKAIPDDVILGAAQGEPAYAVAPASSPIAQAFQSPTQATIENPHTAAPLQSPPTQQYVDPATVAQTQSDFPDIQFTAPPAE